MRTCVDRYASDVAEFDDRVNLFATEPLCCTQDKRKDYEVLSECVAH